MAKQGLLGQARPASTTNTLLYTAPTDSSASTVLSVTASGGADSFDVAIKDYDQRLQLDASTYKLHEGDVVTGYRFNLASEISSDSALSAGASLTSEDGEKSAKFESFYVPPFTEIGVKNISIRLITVNSVSGTFAVGDTISKGASPDDTVATIYSVTEGSGTSSLYIGPSTINGSGTEFTDSDAITSSGGATASISVGGVGTAGNEYAFSVDAGITYNMYLGTDLTVFTDRVYRFDVSDSSMTGTDFKISTTVNGEWGSDGTAGTADDGSEYTTGKTTNGTPGSAGAYIQYDLAAGTLTGSIYYYDGDTATATKSNYGGSDRYILTSTSYTYESIYVYDVDGTWVNATDSFLANGTSYTVQTQTTGAYGYVRDLTGNVLKIILGLNSADFTTSSVFQDAPLDSTVARSAVAVSAVQLATTAVDNEMYLRKDNVISDVTTEEIKSLVIGPGQKLIVESNGGFCSFNLIGFEDNSSAFTTRTYSTQAVQSGSGSGG